VLATTNALELEAPPALDLGLVRLSGFPNYANSFQ